MEERKDYYRRNLPHFQPDHAIFFVTFRLAGSLPVEVIETLRNEEALLEKNTTAMNTDPDRKSKLYELQKRYFGKFDTYLDSVKKGAFWLNNEKVATCVSNLIRQGDEKLYDLIAFCIMPNHVHLVIQLIQPSTKIDNVTRASARANQILSTNPHHTQNSRYILTSILRLLKGRSAREANKILKRTGQFWHHESYDHVIRDEKEEERIIRYVVNNPVKAGFVKDPDEWRWSYNKYELIL